LSSNYPDGAKDGANFGSSAGEKVTIVLFLALLKLGGIHFVVSELWGKYKVLKYFKMTIVTYQVKEWFG
jgi:hypothetical protein